MNISGYTITKRDRYKCEHCDHKTYKTKGGILKHLEDNHALEQEVALLREKLRIVGDKPRVEVREKVVYRDAPKKAEPKYWYVTGIYCSSCKTASRNTGIPVGQTIENTPHHCGNRTLMLITEFN